MEIRSFHLPVADGHQLHVALWGNPQGRPVLFLHGGPGSGCNPSQRGLFDPARDFVVFLDQRGAGQSLPRRSRVHNTLPDLLSDIELLRQHLGIDRWLVTGGSWGATLALAYAETHPERVTALALRAVFLGTRAELEQAFLATPALLCPDILAQFLAVLPPEDRANPLESYWARILDPDPARHVPAAWAWHDLERALSGAPGPILPLVDRSAETALPSTPFMEAHYFGNHCFLPPNALLEGAAALAQIPGIIVQGRFDLLCPPATSAALAARWPQARLQLVESAGHGLDHPAIFQALRTAITELIEG